MAAALDAADVLPAMEPSAVAAKAALVGFPDSLPDLAAAIEGDVALTCSTLRMANSLETHRGTVETIVEAVSVLGAEGTAWAIERPPRFHLFDGDAAVATHRVAWLHANFTQRAAMRIAREIGYVYRDRLRVTALLHDLGRVALAPSLAGPGDHHRVTTTPSRLSAEQARLGLDHAELGAHIAERWCLPSSIVRVIRNHHTDGGGRETQIVRLADLLAHAIVGDHAPARTILVLSDELTIGPPQLERLTIDALQEHLDSRKRSPCPLTDREREVLRGLAGGKVYKEIGADLDVSPSTVRSHLHRIYEKLGAKDRAHAVLIAVEHDWL